MELASNDVRALACMSMLLLACCGDSLVTDVACDEMEPGDIVVTEIHANPDGRDGDREYIELFNASGAELALDGLVLATSKDDGSSLKSHRFGAVSVDAGDYLVVGNAALEPLPAHLDYSYGKSLGSLRNSDARISISCGRLVVDEARYSRTSDGYALQLDGRLQPDHVVNDDPAHWCTATVEAESISPGNFGTPGSANDACEAAPMQGTCLEDVAERSVVAPGPGALRITEWMANPAGADTGLEWVEVAFDAGADLNGFQLGPATDALEPVLDGRDCVPVGAGARVVFGASPEAAPRVDAVLPFSLANSGERSIVAGLDGVVLDQVDYESTETGRAWQLDAKGNVCLASPDEEYFPGNYGTPGSRNPLCPPELGPGMCLDDGVPRMIVSPRAGDVQISEWMANPVAVGNRDGEWIELRVDAAVDLNGVTLSDLTANPTTLEDDACLSVAAGSHLVLVRNLDPHANGGIENALAKLGLSLNNSDETITLSVGDRILDVVTYEDSTPGAATQRDPGGNACDASRPYGDGDLGTPGAANPWCP